MAAIGMRYCAYCQELQKLFIQDSFQNRINRYHGRYHVRHGNVRTLITVGPIWISTMPLSYYALWSEAYLTSYSTAIFTKKESPACVSHVQRYSFCCQILGCMHADTTPRRPQSNGLGESLILIPQSPIHSMNSLSFLEIDRILDNIFTQYRNAAHTITGKILPYIFKSRNLRTTLRGLGPQVACLIRTLHTEKTRKRNQRPFGTGWVNGGEPKNGSTAYLPLAPPHSTPHRSTTFNPLNG